MDYKQDCQIKRQKKYKIYCISARLQNQRPLAYYEWLRISLPSNFSKKHIGGYICENKSE